MVRSLTNGEFRIAYPTLRRELVHIPDDHLKEFACWQERYRGNPFRSLFERLAEAMATGPAHLAGTGGHDRSPSPGSDLSSSSNGDKPEETTRMALVSLIGGLLSQNEVGVLSSQRGVPHYLQV